MLPVGLIYNIVLPTMILKNTVFIGISSRPVDEASPMFRLISKRYPETGKRVIKSSIFTTTCPSCQRRGRRDCTHDLEDHWSSKEQSRKVEILMSDQRETYLREMRNEETTEKLVSAFFARSDIDVVDQTDRDYMGTLEHEYVYVGVDPAAGGMRSKAACLSIVTPTIYDEQLKVKRQEVVVRFPLFLYAYTVGLRPGGPRSQGTASFYFQTTHMHKRYTQRLRRCYRSGELPPASSLPSPPPSPPLLLLLRSRSSSEVGGAGAADRMTRRVA